MRNNSCKVKKIQDNEKDNTLKLLLEKEEEIKKINEENQKNITRLEDFIKEQNIKFDKFLNFSSPVNKKLIKIIADKDKEIYELKNSQTDEVKLNNFIKKLKPNTADLLIINNIQIEFREVDNFINATQLCKAGNKKFNNWLKLDSTKELIEDFSKINNMSKDDFIKKEEKNIWIQLDLSIQLAQWISPIFTLKITQWIHEQLNKELEIRENKITTLEKKFKLKQKRSNYSEKNVIYIITNKQNKKENIYIVGSSIDFKKRLGTYNKSCEHEVIYCKSCNNENEMILIEKMVLTKLDKYREQANRDRFILPRDKTVNYFINVVNECVDFFDIKLNETESESDKDNK